MYSFKAIMVIFAVSLTGGISATPGAELSAAERDAMKFERAKLAAAQSAGRKKSARKPEAPAAAERNKVAPSTATGSAEQAAARFEKAKLAAAQAELRKEGGSDQTSQREEPRTSSKRLSASRPDSR